MAPKSSFIVSHFPQKSKTRKGKTRDFKRGPKGHPRRPKNISQKTSRKTGQFSQKSILWQNIYNLNREIP
jgi:hypothetical protein